jgi:hypothetical protein
MVMQRSLPALVNGDLNLVPKRAECSIELLEPSGMVQAKEPVN